MQGLTKQEGEVSDTARQAIFEALGGVGDYKKNPKGFTKHVGDVYITLRYQGVDAAMQGFEAALSKGILAGEKGERSAKLRPILEGLHKEQTAISKAISELHDANRAANKPANDDIVEALQSEVDAMREEHAKLKGERKFSPGWEKRLDLQLQIEVAAARLADMKAPDDRIAWVEEEWSVGKSAFKNGRYVEIALPVAGPRLTAFDMSSGQKVEVFSSVRSRTASTRSLDETGVQWLREGRIGTERIKFASDAAKKVGRGGFWKNMLDDSEKFAAGDVRGDWESSARLAGALARMFGDDAPPLAVLAEVFSAAGNRVGGRVYGGGIELAEHRAGFGLLSHESLHILQQRGVLSDDEMLALSAAGKRLAATDETIRRRLDAVDENGEKIYTGGALEWEYGALFAEHYTRASKAQRARLAGEELSVFARIVEWLEEAADILRSYFGDNTAKARLFMRRLSRGQVDVEGARTALERSQNIIRDKDGNMAVFYHGTPESFGKYRRGRVKVRDLAGDEDQRVDLGVHFGDEATASNNLERKAAMRPGMKKNIKRAYLSGKNGSNPV